MTTNINDYFPSRYLKAHDLKGKTPTVTIARVTFEQVRGGRTGSVETKAILHFAGKDKGLLLNKTNARTVITIAGTPITEQWTGVTVTLFATVDTFGKEQHDVIRIKAPVAVAAPARRPTSAAPAILTDELEIDLADGRAY